MALAGYLTRHVMWFAGIFLLSNCLICECVSVDLNNIRSTLSGAVDALNQLKASVPNFNGIFSSKLGRPSSCAELMIAGITKSGIYTVYPRPWFDADPFEVYCDMDTDGGGWTVFQRRDDYGELQDNFVRPWSDYRRGFGNLTREFWLGNDHLFLLTNQDPVTLRIDLEDFENNHKNAIYGTFKVASREDDYRLKIGDYKGDAGDSLSAYTDRTFVTFDYNDVNNCSKKFKGGWWYESCHLANLNGLYLKGKHESFADGVNWKTWKDYHYSLKKTEMKIRPTFFLRCGFTKTETIIPQ